MSNNNKKLFTLTAAISLAVFANTSYAVEITASAEYTLGAAPTVTVTSPTSSTSAAVTSYGTSLDNPDSAGNELAFNNFGDNTGSYDSRAEGSGAYNVSSSVTYVDTVMNTGAATNYSFDFNVIPGELYVGLAGNSEGLYSPGYVDSGYNFEILLNGTSIFSSAASLRLDQDGINLTQSGTSLGGTFEDLLYDGYYSWNAFAGTLDLGTMAAGEIFTLTYGVTTYANGAIEPGGSCCIDQSGLSSSLFGDPSGLNATPFTYTTSAAKTVTSVPEASSYILLGIGIASLIGLRRKKKLM